MKPVVYVVTHIPTARMYVGKTNDPRGRWLFHTRTARKGAAAVGFSKIHAAIRKYGEDAFSFRIAETLATDAEAFEAEARWIAALRSNVRGHGFNLDGGGRGGKLRGDATKEKLRAAALANPQRYWLGKKHSEETCARIGAAGRGRKWTEEQRAKMKVSRAPYVGVPRPRWIVEKVRASRTGKKVGPMSDDHKRAISKSHKANPMPTAGVVERAHRGWATRRSNEAAREAVRHGN